MTNLNVKETLALFKRVYNSKIEDTDEQALTGIIKKVFGNGFTTPSAELLREFNSLVIQQAEEVAKPKMQNLLQLFSQYKTADFNNSVKYDIPKEVKARFRRSTFGGAIEYNRVDNAESVTAVPRDYQTGFQYETAQFAGGDVLGTFNKLVDDIADAMLRTLFEEVMQLIQAAITSNKIPAANVLVGDNLTLDQFNKLVTTFVRKGGKSPLFIADTLLIDHIAKQQATVAGGKLITDAMVSDIVEELHPTKIGRATAMSLVNPFVDSTNTKTEYPVNVGYMLAAGGQTKPVGITWFGGLMQDSTYNFEDERVFLKVKFKADVTLLFGDLIGRITENTAVK